MKDKKSKADIFARLDAHKEDVNKKRLDSNPKNAFTALEFCEHEGVMKSSGLVRLGRLVSAGKIKRIKMWMTRGDGRVYLGSGYILVEGPKEKGRHQ